MLSLIKEVRVPILILVRIDFKAQKVTQVKQKYYVMIKKKTVQENSYL